MSQLSSDSILSGLSAQTMRRNAGNWLMRPKPVGFYLFLLIFVTILPAIAVSVVLLERTNESQREVTRTLAEATVGSINQAIDRELASMATTLRVLATSPALTDGHMAEFYQRARSALEGTGTYVIVIDENFRQLVNTRVPYGTPLGSMSEPDIAAAALQNHTGTFSGVFYSKTAKKWVFDAFLPILRPDGPPLLLTLARNTDDLAETLNRQNLRGGWNASIIDTTGKVVASSFLSSNVGKEFFLWPLEMGKATRDGRVTENSPQQSFEMVTTSSGFSGWKAVLWAPTAAIEQPMRNSLRTLVVGGLVVITIGALAAWVLGRQVTRPVKKLAADAHRLGAGEPVQAVAYPIAEITTVSNALAEAAVERKRAENEIRLLMREVAHRSKNQLTVVASIAKQSVRNARTFASFQDAFQKRLYGLARSTDLLIAGGAGGVDLRELLSAQIDPFRPEDSERFDLAGPAFRLENQAAQSIGLAMHELATNASKYGAFSVPEGRLSLAWTIEGDCLRIDWREYLPRLRKRVARRGFGTEIIERMVGLTLDAEITRTFHRDGLECVFKIPIARLVPERQVPEPTGTG